jgi:hypothetical protein
MASSLRDATSGMIMTPMTKPALMELNVLNPGNQSCRSGVIKVRAKNP